jgi:hypothetical protein
MGAKTKTWVQTNSQLEKSESKTHAYVMQYVPPKHDKPLPLHYNTKIKKTTQN